MHTQAYIHTHPKEEMEAKSHHQGPGMLTICGQITHIITNGETGGTGLEKMRPLL